MNPPCWTLTLKFTQWLELTHALARDIDRLEKKGCPEPFRPQHNQWLDRLKEIKRKIEHMLYSKPFTKTVRQTRANKSL